MSGKRKALLLTLLFCYAFALSVDQAAESRWDAVGIRGGSDLTDDSIPGKGNFAQYELFANYLLPWSWRRPSGLELRTRLDASGGVLTRKGDWAFVAALGPGIALELFSGRVELDGGGSVTFLSRHKFSGRDLGGPYMFNMHGGIGAFVYRDIGIGYHYEHISNAYLYSKNPGLNLHMLELEYRF